MFNFTIEYSEYAIETYNKILGWFVYSDMYIYYESITNPCFICIYFLSMLLDILVCQRSGNEISLLSNIVMQRKTEKNI